MAGLFSSAGLFGTDSTPAQIVTTTPYDQMMQSGQGGNFNSMANGNSTYLADMFSQLGTGQAPSYYQSYQNQAHPYMQGLLNQQYFGTPGNRATNMYGSPTAYGLAQSQGVMQGLNPKAQTAQLGKVNEQWQNASSALDQLILQNQFNMMQKTADSLPGWATGQQNALSDAFHPTTNMIPAQSGSLGLFGNMVAQQAGAANSMMGFSGLQNLFGGGGGSSGGYAGGINAGSQAMNNAGIGQSTFSMGGPGFAAAPRAF